MRLDKSRVNEILESFNTLDIKPREIARIFMEEALVSLTERVESTGTDTLRRLASIEYANIRLGVFIPALVTLSDLGEANIGELESTTKRVVQNLSPIFRSQQYKYYSSGMWFSYMWRKALNTMKDAGIISIDGARVKLEVEDPVEIISRYYGSIPDNIFKQISFERGLVFSVIHEVGPAGIDKNYIPERLEKFHHYQLRNWRRKYESIKRAHIEGTGFLLESRYGRLIRSPNRVANPIVDRVPASVSTVSKYLIELGVLTDRLVYIIGGSEARRKMLELSRWADNIGFRTIIRMADIYIDGFRAQLLKMMHPQIELEQVIPFIATIYDKASSLEEAKQLRKALHEVLKELVRTGQIEEPEDVLQRYVVAKLHEFGLIHQHNHGRRYTVPDTTHIILKAMKRIVE